MNIYLPDPTKMLMAFTGALIILLAASGAAGASYVPDPGDHLGLELVESQSPSTGGDALTTVPRVQEDPTVEFSPPCWLHRKGQIGPSVATPDIPIMHSPHDEDIAWTYNIGKAIDGWFAAVAEAGAIGVPY